MVLGVILYRNCNWNYVNKGLPYLRPMIVIAAVPYGAAMLVLNGWFSHDWSGLGDAATRLSEVHFLPFYYHYYTAEAVAVVSLRKAIVTNTWAMLENTAIAARMYHIVTGVRLGDGVKCQPWSGRTFTPIPDSTAEKIMKRSTMLLGLSVFLSWRNAARAMPPRRAVVSPIP